MTEVKLRMPNLKLSVQKALQGCVTRNLAGLYAVEKEREVQIYAYFFSAPTDLDREYVDDAAGYVVADYPWDCMYMVDTQFKLMSEITPKTVDWMFLREEVSNYVADPVQATSSETPHTAHSPGSSSIESRIVAQAEVQLPTPELSLIVQSALLGQVTENLAGFYVTEEAQNIFISACFFTEQTELDRKCLEAVADKVIAYFPKVCKVLTEHKLVSEVERGSVYWLFLRAEVYNDADDQT